MSASSSSCSERSSRPVGHVDVARRAGADAAAGVPLGGVDLLRGLEDRRPHRDLDLAVTLESNDRHQLTCRSRATRRRPSRAAASARRRPRVCPSMARAIARFIRRAANALRRVVERLDARAGSATGRRPRAAASSARMAALDALLLAGREQRPRRPRAPLRVAARMRRASTRFSARRRARRSSSPWSSASMSICSTASSSRPYDGFTRDRLLDARRQLLARARSSRPSASTRNVTSSLAIPAGHRRDALEREAREAPVVGDHLALALQRRGSRSRSACPPASCTSRAPRQGWSCCAGGSCRRRRRRPRCRARAGGRRGGARRPSALRPRAGRPARRRRARRPGPGSMSASGSLPKSFAT